MSLYIFDISFITPGLRWAVLAESKESAENLAAAFCGINICPEYRISDAGSGILYNTKELRP